MTPLHDAGSLPFGCGAAPKVVCSASCSCILQPTHPRYPHYLDHTYSTLPSYLLNRNYTFPHTDRQHVRHQRPRRPQDVRWYVSKRAPINPAPTTANKVTDTSYKGSGLRIGIVHARWNTKIIDALLEGTKRKLKEAGVKDENIVTQSVPGSYELPYAVKQYA